MRNLLLGAAIVALAAGSAIAADMPLKAPPLAPAAPSWTGCYVDAGAGYGIWDQEHTTTTSFGGVPNGITVENSGGGRGWLGRFGGGCDYQLSGGFFSNVVIGAFGDYDAMSLRGSMSPLTIGGGFPLVANENETGAWAAGARIGYLITPSILTYVDAGWTGTRYSQMNITTNLGVGTGVGFPQHTYQGWFIGSGWEYALNWAPVRGLFLRSEYRYGTYENADLLQINFATGAPVGNAGLGDVLHATKYVQTATTSLVWRFNWPN
jgi:outer membrane immunogenic protein